jgi:uncharacterized protein (DUF885 family)
MTRSHTELAVSYFDYLAERFPVMCASDEFHFLPRAQTASQYYDRLDNVARQLIDETVRELKEFQENFNALSCQDLDLEDFIDLEMLKANVAGILLEFEQNQSLRHNPLLYLKIAFIGLDQALTKPASTRIERSERVLARLLAIPRLLRQAVENIDSVPDTYHQAAAAMLGDCKTYLAEVSEDLPQGRSGLLRKGIDETFVALDFFAHFLSSLSPLPVRHFAGVDLEIRLRDHFLSKRSLPEVYQIAVEEWSDNLRELKKLQMAIDSDKTWQELYHDYSPAEVGQVDTISLYEREIERLRRFFGNHGFKENELNSSLAVCETPAYLRSVRSAASFAAAFSADAKEESFFYITTHLPEQRGEDAGELLRKRLHREYKFLAAHETIPGHQLLDWVRRNLENPVRRQIESPLFYEGWAYYAESLLTEYGYVENPRDLLVDRKRSLWRAARCQIDVGLHTGILARENAIELLTTTGFSSEEANAQIDRFHLNPGYQLCYTLGRHEIRKLKKTHTPRIGGVQFNRQLLQGGELPFHLIDKRLAGLGLKSGKPSE